MLEIQNVSKTFNAGTVNQKTALNGLHLFWEGNPKALYEFKNGDKQFVDTYTSFEHDNRYSDNIVENAYVDELANFFACLRGEETSRWSFEQDLAAIRIMDKT